MMCSVITIVAGFAVWPLMGLAWCPRVGHGAECGKPGVCPFLRQVWGQARLSPGSPGLAGVGPPSWGLASGVGLWDHRAPLPSFPGCPKLGVGLSQRDAGWLLDASACIRVTQARGGGHWATPGRPSCRTQAPSSVQDTQTAFGAAAEVCPLWAGRTVSQTVRRLASGSREGVRTGCPHRATPPYRGRLSGRRALCLGAHLPAAPAAQGRLQTALAAAGGAAAGHLARLQWQLL